MSRRTIVFSLVALIACIQSSYGYAMGTRPPQRHVPIRVIVLKGIPTIDVQIKGPYKIIDYEDEARALKEEERPRNFKISAEDFTSKGITILLQERSRIYVNGRQFRGNIDIIKHGAAELTVVNYIDLEEYLYGVLYHEVSHRWPIEVLKVQAIAARTYALYQKLISQEQDYDLTSDIYSQVYGGRTSETRRTTMAVNLTKGVILTYDGKVFPAYYHATCGGRTSRANTLWRIDIPTLGGVSCNFCSISPHCKWTKELTRAFIQEKLKEAGYGVQFSSIEVVERDEAGRILRLVLKGQDGDIELTGNKFRLLMDPNLIKSTNFEVKARGNFFEFYGRGWGHGIGMCQWGAYNMARQGWKAKEILEYYYPGAEIVQIE